MKHSNNYYSLYVQIILFCLIRVSSSDKSWGGGGGGLQLSECMYTACQLMRVLQHIFISPDCP